MNKTKFKIHKGGEEMHHSKEKILIYGRAGVGKTTLVFSAPKPMLLDLEDYGVERVSHRYQKDWMHVNSYDELMEIVRSGILNEYETIIIDSYDYMLRMIQDKICAINPKLKTGNDSLTQKGWGELKGVATRFLYELFKLDKHFIFTAHDKEEKNGDEFFFRPDAGGKSIYELIKMVGFVGYMKQENNKRLISFEPDADHIAKNYMGLSGFMEIQSADTFFSDLIENLHKQKSEEAKIRREYDALLSEQDTKLSKVGTPEDLDLLIKELKDQETKIIWGSRLIFWNKIKKLAKDKFNMEYDNANNKFVLCDA